MAFRTIATPQANGNLKRKGLLQGHTENVKLRPKNKWSLSTRNEQNLQQMQKKKNTGGTSLVAQWLRIHLPMQGTRVRALVQEDPTCLGATKPVHHNY